MSGTGLKQWGAKGVLAGFLAGLHVLLPALLEAQPAQSRAAVSASQPATAATTSGVVSSMSGPVFIRRGKDPEVLAKPGDVFGPGTTIRTAEAASAVLLFADGQTISLSGNSTLRIDDYFFDPRDIKSSHATLGLMRGMMRLVTGAIHTAQREALVISAGNASIGILSKDVTAFVVEVDPKSLGVGAAAVVVGEISIQTPSGNVEQLDADQFVRWTNGAPPSASMPLAAAPASFQSLVAAARANAAPAQGPIDVLEAAVRIALADLPASGAGQAPDLQAQAPQSSASLVLPSATPGGGRGCVGSPC